MSCQNTPSNSSHTCSLKEMMEDSRVLMEKVKLTLYHLILGVEVVKYNQAVCKEKYFCPTLLHKHTYIIFIYWHFFAMRVQMLQ